MNHIGNAYVDWKLAFENIHENAIMVPTLDYNGILTVVIYGKIYACENGRIPYEVGCLIGNPIFKFINKQYYEVALQMHKNRENISELSEYIKSAFYQKIRYSNVKTAKFNTKIKCDIMASIFCLVVSHGLIYLYGPEGNMQALNVRVKLYKVIYISDKLYHKLSDYYIVCAKSGIMCDDPRLENINPV